MLTIPMRLPGRGEIRLRMKAIGVNRGDVLYRKGGYPNQPPSPSTFGFERAGEVVESIGAGVKGFALGDAVSIGPLPTRLLRQLWR
jgi:NADPH:quinone reductase-like Zn-dependent oxidoreductase